MQTIPTDSPDLNPYVAPAVPVASVAETSTEEGPIMADGPMTVQDYRRAKALATRQPLWVRILLTGIAYAVAAAYFFFQTPPVTPLLVRIALAGVVALMMVGVIWGLGIAPRYFGGRAACDQLNRVRRRVFTDEYVTAFSDDGEVRMRWSAYSGFRCSGDVLVLFHNKVAPLVLFEPITAAQIGSVDEWRRFLDLLHRTFSKRQPG